MNIDCKNNEFCSLLKFKICKMKLNANNTEKEVINANNLLQCIDKGSDYKHWNKSKIMYD